MDSSKLSEEQEGKLLSKSSAETSDVPGPEIKEIYAFGAGLKSLRDVVGLSLFSKLEFLSLHDNYIDRIECLETLPSLRELNLSSNNIKEMEGLSTLSQLQVLNLSCNEIDEIKNLQGLRALKKLVLSHNHIRSLHGLSALGGPRYSLRYLDLRDNRVDSISELRVLAGCIYLKEISFSRGNHTNPVCQAPAYKISVIAATPHLHKLDGELLSGHLPGQFRKTLPQFGDTFQSYLDASVPSWVLQYASFGRSEEGSQNGESRNSSLPNNNSEDSQPGKVLFTSQPQVSVVSKPQLVECIRQDDSGSRLCPGNPVPIDILDRQSYSIKANHCTYSGSQQTIPWNLPSGSKIVGTYQAQEDSKPQHASVQTVGWSDQPSPTPHNVVLSHFQRAQSEDLEQEFIRTDEELEVNTLSRNTRPGLPITNHALNGFYRRRWPSTNSAPPSTRCTRVEDGSDGERLEGLEKRILDLVHELALVKSGANRGTQALEAKSSHVVDYKLPKSSIHDNCERERVRCTRKGKKNCYHYQVEKKHSSSSDTPENQELKTKSKSRRRVWWSDEPSNSGDSMKRWVILVRKWISRINPTKSDCNSASVAEGGELQEVLQLLNQEVKHLHQAVASLNSGPKVEETQMRSEVPADIMSESRNAENDTGDSKHEAKFKTLEDEIAETKQRFHDEEKDLYKRLDAKQDAVVELEKVLQDKNFKLQELLKYAKQSFPNQKEDPAACPEDKIRETIISAKAEILSMENSLQKATLVAQSAKAAFLNATSDKENSKQLVISMYKALEEERENLKMCKSELETCQSHCLEIKKERQMSKQELENMFEEKKKELTLIKMLKSYRIEDSASLLRRLHKQEIESIRALGVELGKSQGIALAEESSAQFRHTMREQLLDTKTVLNEARKENVKVRQDMASLHGEHQKEVAELKEVIQTLLSKEENKDAIILELSNVVRSQKAQLQAVNFDVEKLAVTEKALQRKQQEISTLKLKNTMCDDLAQKVEGLQQKLTEVSQDAKFKAIRSDELAQNVESLQQTLTEVSQDAKFKATRCEELSLTVESLQQKLTKVSQDANDKADNANNLISQLMSLQQENTKLASSIKRLEVSEDAVKIKNKMLESQNERIKDLKEELSEAKAAFNRLLTSSESLETEWIKRLRNEAEKGEDLRRECKSQALAMEAVEEKLKVERVAKLAAEKTSKLLQQKVEEKEEMLRYVEDEISQVKILYDDKVRAIAVERDQAMEQLQKTRKEIEKVKEELLEEGKKGRELSLEAQKCRDLLEARNALQNQVETLKAKLSEKDLQLKEAGRRILEVESQLENQTLAMAKQKAVASSKVEQLRRVLEDLGDFK